MRWGPVGSDVVGTPLGVACARYMEKGGDVPGVNALYSYCHFKTCLTTGSLLAFVYLRSTFHCPTVGMLF